MPQKLNSDGLTDCEVRDRLFEHFLADIKDALWKFRFHDKGVGDVTLALEAARIRPGAEQDAVTELCDELNDAGVEGLDGERKGA